MLGVQGRVSGNQRLLERCRRSITFFFVVCRSETSPSYCPLQLVEATKQINERSEIWSVSASSMYCCLTELSLVLQNILKMVSRAGAFSLFSLSSTTLSLEKQPHALTVLGNQTLWDPSFNPYTTQPLLPNVLLLKEEPILIAVILTIWPSY